MPYIQTKELTTEEKYPVKSIFDFSECRRTSNFLPNMYVLLFGLKAVESISFNKFATQTSAINIKHQQSTEAESQSSQSARTLDFPGERMLKVCGQYSETSIQQTSLMSGKENI